MSEGYVVKGNYSGKRVTGEATKGILARECDEGALKQVLKNTRPSSGNTKLWNNAESARGDICGKFKKWKNGNANSEPSQYEVEYLFGLSEWAKQAGVGEPGSVASGNTGSVASNPRAATPAARRRRGTRRRRSTRRRRANTRRH